MRADLYWLNRGWGDPHRTVDMVVSDVAFILDRREPLPRLVSWHSVASCRVLLKCAAQGVRSGTCNADTPHSRSQGGPASTQGAGIRVRRNGPTSIL